MATFRERLPSSHQSLLLFAGCAVPVYSWAMFCYFWKVPGWEKYLNLWHMASLLAYVLAFALAESFLVFLALLLLHFALPTPVVRRGFVSKGSTLVLVNAVWAIVLHFVILNEYIFLWTFTRYLLYAVLYLISVIVTWFLVHRCARFAEHVEALIDRMTVLLYIYVPLSAFSVLIVVVRNLLW